MSRKSGLGRGFDSLIPSELLDESFDPTADQDERVSDLRQIKIDEIHPDPDQPRRSFDEASLTELANSIKEHGILQPIVITPLKSGGYQVVAGERRYRATKQAGLAKIPALIRTPNAQHKLELSLIENIQRRDLNALETATAYLKLRDQFNMTLDQIGKRVGGKSVSTISNTLRLLRLPEVARTALIEGKLSEGQARPLINLEPEQIEAVLPTILRQDWTARQIEQYVVQLKKSKNKTVATPKPITHTPYEDEVKVMTKRFGAPVKVSTNAKGAGKIVISFKSEREFRRIQQLLGDS